MKIQFLTLLLCFSIASLAQTPVDLTHFEKKGSVNVQVDGNNLEISWPAGEKKNARIIFSLLHDKPLFSSIQLSDAAEYKEIIKDTDPVFILTEGKRDLAKRGGWDIFFDITAYLPHRSHVVSLDKQKVEVATEGSRTRIRFSKLTAGNFTGDLEISLFNGSPLMKVEAIMSTAKDSVAIVYDAGIVGAEPGWNDIFWSDPGNALQSVRVDPNAGSTNLAVKYRTVIGENENGSIAVFPPPHQYFYPLDNAYNLKYTWYGNNYREMLPGCGIGIRHEPLGDLRFVPWFNAPPETEQRLSFFCLLGSENEGMLLENVKAFTHADSYKALPGYKTMASHFHTEHTNDILTHRPVPEIPGHVVALKDLGVNIMHLGEFHLFRGGHPYVNMPVKRLLEYHTMFEECERLSDDNFLMLPGEEPNRHFGGHWMNLFPRPVYWMLSREPNEPFVENHPDYGKVYRVGNQEEMLKLLELENGLAWTAHARVKGSTGYPDKYKNEEFFHSDRFLGAAWKNLPTDLSRPRLGERVLNLMNDMANWGHQKYVIGEADLFRLEPGYEIYGPMNINYLQLDSLPRFNDGWQPVLDAMEKGKFFVTTGEVLLPSFTVNGAASGETLKLPRNGKAKVEVTIEWTFPLNFAEIISGDGEKVYRERIELHDTQAFGKKEFSFPVNLKGRKWVRFEVWDVAANGAFTQMVWL